MVLLGFGFLMFPKLAYERGDHRWIKKKKKFQLNDVQFDLEQEPTCSSTFHCYRGSTVMIEDRWLIAGGGTQEALDCIFVIALINELINVNFFWLL